jgi:hypothetical protein
MTFARFEKMLQDKSVVELEYLYNHRNFGKRRKDLIQSYIVKQIKEIDTEIDLWVNSPLLKLALTHMYRNKMRRLRKSKKSPIQDRPEASRRTINGRDYYVADNLADVFYLMINILNRVAEASIKNPEILYQFNEYLKTEVEKHKEYGYNREI